MLVWVGVWAAVGVPTPSKTADALPSAPKSRQFSFCDSYEMQIMNCKKQYHQTEGSGGGECCSDGGGGE
jgi:hypothetical protein